MMLSRFGNIVNDEWIKSFALRKELYLDEYMIMPNHLHAIVVLDKPQTGKTNETLITEGTTGLGGMAGLDGSPGSPVETHGRASLKPEQPNNPSFIRKTQSISSFIAGYKSAINSKIDDCIDLFGLPMPKYNKSNHFFQPNYHDHIIRNHPEYLHIKEYIIKNPQKWNDDRFKL